MPLYEFNMKKLRNYLFAIVVIAIFAFIVVSSCESRKENERRREERRAERNARRTDPEWQFNTWLSFGRAEFLSLLCGKHELDFDKVAKASFEYYRRHDYATRMMFEDPTPMTNAKKPSSHESFTESMKAEVQYDEEVQYDASAYSALLKISQAYGLDSGRFLNLMIDLRTFDAIRQSGRD